MEVLVIALTGFFNVVCFIIGAKVGQTVARGEKVEMPKIDLFKGCREREARKEMKKEQEQLNTVLRNINRYDGTSKGQEDVG